MGRRLRKFVLLLAKCILTLDKDKALKLINSEDTLNVFFGASYASLGKVALRKRNISFISYPFLISCLPKRYSKKEYDRCNKISILNLRGRYNEIDFSKYKNIIVWGDNDLHHLLGFALISKTIDEPKIYYVNTYETYNKRIGELCPEELLQCIITLKFLTKEKRKKIEFLYDYFPSDRNSIKVLIDGLPYEYPIKLLKQLSLDVIDNTDFLNNPIRKFKAMGVLMTYFKRYGFYDAIWEYIIVELIRDQELEVLEIIEYEKNERKTLWNIPPVDNKLDLNKIKNFTFKKKIQSNRINMNDLKIKTDVKKTANGVSFEMTDLPKDFSYTYAFYRSVELEMELLKKDIRFFEAGEDKQIIAYLKAALEYNEGLCQECYPLFMGGFRNTPIFEAIYRLSEYSKITYKNSVAYCIKDRLDTEIKFMRKEKQLCKTIHKLQSNDNYMEVLNATIQKSPSENEAVKLLVEKLRIKKCEADFIVTKLTLKHLCDRDLGMRLLEEVDYVLKYLEYLQTIEK